jgi:hypothetical protein
MKELLVVIELIDPCYIWVGERLKFWSIYYKDAKILLAQNFFSNGFYYSVYPCTNGLHFIDNLTLVFKQI